MSQDWHPSDIKSALEKKGTNLSQLSRACGLKSRTLGNALRIPYIKAEVIIADCIGVEPEIIWPSRYQKLRGKRHVDNNQ
jgi:Ner family transcriptional regulator